MNHTPYAGQARTAATIFGVAAVLSDIALLDVNGTLNSGSTVLLPEIVRLAGSRIPGFNVATYGSIFNRKRYYDSLWTSECCRRYRGSSE